MDENDYNFSNKIVAEALFVKYRFKMSEYAELSDGNLSNGNDSKGNSSVEYICVTCKKWLSKKIPRMPAQAVANGLDLTPIPPELLNLNDLE